MANDDDIDLWATDEVHFQQHGSRCRMWIPPEDKDPILLHHPTRKSVGFFGAVRLRDGKLVFRREEDNFNAATFFTFMKQLRSVTAACRRRVVVISDNAKYHLVAFTRNGESRFQEHSIWSFCRHIALT